MERLGRKGNITLPLACFSLVLGAFLCWKWWRIFILVCQGLLYSDVPLHIQLALGNEDYGLSSVIIKLLYLGGESFAQRGLAVCLTGNNILGLFTVAAFIRFMLPRLSWVQAFLAAELAHICGPWLIPGYQMELYINAHNGNLYHNMTVLFSRTLIPLCLVFFFKCWEERHAVIPRGSWLGFMLSFLVVTAFKPNFAFAFIPLYGVLLLWDFIKYKGKYFKNEFILGCAVLPAGFVCIWQYLALFSAGFGESSSQMMAEPTAGEESSIALRVLTGGELLALLIMYLRSLLLPVYSFALQGPREEHKKRIGLFLWIEAIALLEASFLTETGYRATHGNFDWGGLSLYPAVFALSIGLLWRMMQGAELKKPGSLMKCLVGLGLLFGHLLAGYCFMWLYNSGVGYHI